MGLFDEINKTRNLFDDLYDIDQENDQTLEIANKIYSDYNNHLLISGWSDIELDDNSFKVFKKILNLDVFLLNKYTWHKEDDFYCFDMAMNELEIKNLRKTIKGFLKLFGDYVNIELRYQKEKNGESFLDYLDNVSSECLEERIITLGNKMKELSTKENNKINPFDSLSEKFSNRYLRPGIERLSSESIDAKILKIIKEAIKESCIPKEIEHLRNLSYHHFYHHPKHSFPLPILLEDPVKMPEYKDIWNTKELDDEYSIYVPKGKPLAYYSRNPKKYECIGPHIVLCPFLISETAKDLGIYEGIVYLTVLVHEFAHAMMDQKWPDNILKSFFAHAMEESLANMITLEWISKNDNDDIEDVKHFMEEQPAIYEFGIKQFYAKVDWKKWRDSEKNMPELKDWFEACFEGGGIKDDITNDFVKNQFDKLFP